MLPKKYITRDNFCNMQGDISQFLFNEILYISLGNELKINVSRGLIQLAKAK